MSISKKVYCKNCKYYRYNDYCNEPGGNGRPHQCLKNFRTETRVSSIDGEYVVNTGSILDCTLQNEYMDCEDYENDYYFVKLFVFVFLILGAIVLLGEYIEFIRTGNTTLHILKGVI